MTPELFTDILERLRTVENRQEALGVVLVQALGALIEAGVLDAQNLAHELDYLEASVADRLAGIAVKRRRSAWRRAHSHRAHALRAAVAEIEAVNEPEAEVREAWAHVLGLFRRVLELPRGQGRDHGGGGNG